MLKEVEISKELDDVLICLVKIAGDVKAKKSVAEIVGGSFAQLMAAFDGFDKLPEEAKVNFQAFSSTIGYRLGELVSVFAAPGPVAPPELPPAA